MVLIVEMIRITYFYIGILIVGVGVGTEGGRCYLRRT